MVVIITIGLLVGSWLLIRGAAIRFANQQRRLGRWDDEGPLVETRGPPHMIEGGGMSERLEVAGLWPAPLIKDRRPTAGQPRSEESKSPDDPNRSE